MEYQNVEQKIDQKEKRRENIKGKKLTNNDHKLVGETHVGVTGDQGHVIDTEHKPSLAAQGESFE